MRPADTCEWDPERCEAATTERGCQRPAAVIVGADGKWRLCSECAGLPAFKRYKRRKAIEKRAAPSDMPSEADIAEYLAGHAARREEALAAAGGRPVALDCEAAGKTPCWNCALDGPEKCLENHLPRRAHDACVAEARRLYVERGKAPCHDCAFIRDSHEARQEGLLDKLVRQREPFYCHQAMPLDGRGQTPAEGNYAPDDHARYPVCTGWARAREAYLARRAAARALPAIRARVAKTARARIVATLGLQRFGERRRRARVRTLTRIVPPGFGLWCTTPRRRAIRAELAIVQQRLVTRGFRIVGEIHRRETTGGVEHRILSELGETPWIRGEAGAAMDAFAVVLIRAGLRAGLGDGPDKPPPYNRPPPKKTPPKPKSRRPPRPLPKPLMLRAA